MWWVSRECLASQLKNRRRNGTKKKWKWNDTHVQTNTIILLTSIIRISWSLWAKQGVWKSLTASLKMYTLRSLTQSQVKNEKKNRKRTHVKNYVRCLWVTCARDHLYTRQTDSLRKYECKGKLYALKLRKRKNKKVSNSFFIQFEIEINASLCVWLWAT